MWAGEGGAGLRRAPRNFGARRGGPAGTDANGPARRLRWRGGGGGDLCGDAAEAQGYARDLRLGRRRARLAPPPRARARKSFATRLQKMTQSCSRILPLLLPGKLRPRTL